MSTARIGAFLTVPDDPRKIELVLSLLTKTREGKVSWTKSGNAFTASIPNGIFANFVLGTGLFGTAPDWQLFTVRDKAGNELMQVNSTSLLSFISKSSAGPLEDATNQLFAAVSGISGNELEEAIESLKKL